jgi:hypothetical protein
LRSEHTPSVSPKPLNLAGNGYGDCQFISSRIGGQL